ncbi:methyl-accepting chemotaxis protein [Nitrospira defluvii]|uniref:Globin-coupled methyl-accepting chemotaxis protein (Modular protein) n=1 Tax=Nitrospira defluvii TaxID=330214 RepID=A0ABM8RWX8_9BACT|nr:methyl-accepting chemotaxis protein [Nitrospira defluvii]CAE6776092.1 Globin-coupled methyl-accepting chemotaxis protein (Modular protein) [Nitrospira defluvii]
MGLNVELLESSFKLVAPQGDALVTRFYERLFEKYPVVKPLFKNASISEQKKKLLASLVLVIQNLRHPEKLTPVLQDMGARHVAYGAKPAYYDAVGENLLAVLGEFAGEAWTPEVSQAWTDAYAAIKTIMLEGAKRVPHTQGEKKMSKAPAKSKTKALAQVDMSEFYLGALEQSQNNILLCDRNLVITYANSTAKKTLTALEPAIKKVLPKFNVSTVVGTCIDEFHLDPSKQRRILSDPANMPHRADIQIGPLTLSLLVTAVMSPSGEYLGNALEWADVTEKRKMEQQAAAMSKSQAIIEFNLDGTIVTANDNFLSCLGYTLDEIKGQHHRMFCDPAYVGTIEYQAFWAKLNRGEFDSGVYKRIAKGGREIWIQAVYNPILNAAGKATKVVKFATDITAQKQSQFEMEKLVAEAQAVLGRLANNDLTQEMTESYRGDLDKVKTSINAVVQNLTQTITAVREAVQAVSSGAEQITKGNEDLSQRTSEQASALEETSASMEEMTSTVKQNADNAKQANQLAIAARDIADKGGSVTVRAVEAMGEINKSSKKIADIITVIDEIAFQTNLLALNAAVEAARAGEHGRGFAVVAAEVRNLAQRSATAAKEIKGLINESIQRVSDGSELVNQSGKTLEEIVSSVKRVTDIIAEITAASQEQAQGIDQVNKAIMQMDETTQQNAALVEETTSASQSMKDQAKELMSQMEVFVVNASEGHAPVRTAASSARTAGKPAVAVTKPGLKKPSFSAKPSEIKQPVGVAAGNGHDRHKKDDDFEEF